MPVTEVADVTGFPECLDGRVKTLHPGVHAGLLADRRQPEHVATLAELGYEPFDLLVSNLYPFAATVASGASPDECVEQIDIGGPAMIRAGAKNHASVAVVVSPDRLRRGARGGRRRRLHARRAAAAGRGGVRAHRRRTTSRSPSGSPRSSAADEAVVAAVRRAWRCSGRAVLRYGENPHQAAALYVDASVDGRQPRRRRAAARQADVVQQLRRHRRRAAGRARLPRPAVAIIKHANPCGIAVGGGLDPIADAHAKAHACDPVSAFGG